MAIKAQDIIMAAVGFLLVAILTPMGMTTIVSTNSTFNQTGVAATYAAVYTIFTILVPILYLIGCALYFIPKIREG